MDILLALFFFFWPESRFDAALSAPVRSVMDKVDTAPSGDKHDYLSYAPYWFPDPAKPDGPYIRRDGYRNEELVRRGDSGNFTAMVRSVETLSRSRERMHHDNAVLRIRTWFLNPKTRMNPHLEYGQAIPGKTAGRGAGLITMRALLDVVDALPALEKSGAWTREDDAAMRKWVADWVRWLETSEIGKAEAKARNNHGSWYAAQAIGLNIYLGRKERAREIAEMVPARMAWQIEKDGRQPLETERQDGISYSLFNLEALLETARRAQAVGVDLYDPALQRAFDYVAPVVRGEKQWPFRQRAKVDAKRLDEIRKLSGGRLR